MKLELFRSGKSRTMSLTSVGGAVFLAMVLSGCEPEPEPIPAEPPLTQEERDAELEAEREALRRTEDPLDRRRDDDPLDRRGEDPLDRRDDDPLDRRDERQREEPEPPPG